MHLDVATHCPAEEAIVLYGLEAIPDEREAASIEEHLLVCEGCQDRLIAADHANTSLMRAALARFAIVPVEICAVHETAEGIVYLWVSEGAENCWIARIKGCEVDSGHIADSHLEAVRLNNMTFRSMFPEHICSARCSSDGITMG
jgi:hypothetical protein